MVSHRNFYASSLILALFFIIGITVAIPMEVLASNKYRPTSTQSTEYQYIDEFDSTDLRSILSFITKNENITTTATYTNALKSSELFLKIGLFEDASVFIKKAELIADSLHFSLKEKLLLFEIQSSLYECNNNSNNALELWKNILKVSEKQIDINLSCFALYHIIRIYNDQNLPEKAQLYLHVYKEFQKTDVSQDLVFKLQSEEIRTNLFSSNNELAIVLLEDLFKKQLAVNKIESSAYLRLLKLSDMIKVDKAINDQLFQQLESDYPSIKNIYTKQVLAQQLSNYYLTHDKQKAVFFLQQAAEAKNSQILLEGSFFDFIDETIQFQRQDHDSAKLEAHSSKTLIWIVLLIIISLLIAISVILIIRIRNLKINYLESILKIENKFIQFKNNISNLDLELGDRISDRVDALNNELTERERIDIELKDALDKAENANYLKNAFLANMSNEIRTPLNGILGFSTLLETELAIIDQPELFEYANSIQKSGDRLLHLLNNIIDISRLEANDLDLNITSCNLEEIIDNLLNVHQFRANDKGIKIVKDLSLSYAMADYATLSRVLNEILDNAIKYTEKGFVKISILTQENENKVVVNIKDTGIGIDSSYIPHIYEAFRQESLGYSRQYQGAGLGIPLAKRLIEKMAGEFQIESEKSIGTHISITLPLVLIPTQEIIMTDILNVDEIQLSVSKNILIVEDDTASRRILFKLLEKYATVAEAKDGDQAISIVNEYKAKNIVFDLMLFDINLPAPWDGIKLLHEIKTKISDYKTVPFIAQTAYAMGGDRERLLEAGFNEYLSKPIQRKELFQTISQVINQTD